jgi:hypothetical protein
VEQKEKIDLQAWFAGWEWETSLPRPAATEAAAQARRHAASLSFDRERMTAAGDVEKMLLATTCGVLAERFDCVRTFLRDQVPATLPSGAGWRAMLRRTVFSGWTKALIGDFDGSIQALIAFLRAAQGEHESSYLDAAPEPRAAAWELVALYHLMAALVQIADGKPLEEVEASLDRALISCLRADHYDLHGLICRVSAAFRVVYRGGGVIECSGPPA